MDLSVTIEDLPVAMAERVRQVQADDPAQLTHSVMYGMTRRVIFETLAHRWPR